VVERRALPETDGLTLVAEGQATGNGAAVAVRTIVTRRPDRLSIARLTRRPGGAFLLRHAYEFSRAP
jgi:hypothetical protein